MPKLDKERALPTTDLTTMKNEPGRQTRRRTRTAPGAMVETPTDVFRQPARLAISPERTAFREALPGLYASMSVTELSKRFNIPISQVRYDILSMQQQGLLPSKKNNRSTEDLPYDQAFQRMTQLNNIIHHAVEANHKITLEEAIEALRSQITWATEIFPDAVRVVFNRVKKELGLEEPRPTRRKKTTIKYPDF